MFLFMIEMANNFSNWLNLSISHEVCILFFIRTIIFKEFIFFYEMIQNKRLGETSIFLRISETTKITPWTSLWYMLWSKFRQLVFHRMRVRHAFSFCLSFTIFQITYSSILNKSFESNRIFKICDKFNKIYQIYLK